MHSILQLSYLSEGFGILKVPMSNVAKSHILHRNHFPNKTKEIVCHTISSIRGTVESLSGNPDSKMPKFNQIDCTVWTRWVYS